MFETIALIPAEYPCEIDSDIYEAESGSDQ